MKFTLFIFGLTLLYSCQSNEIEEKEPEKKGNTSDVFTKVYKEENIEAETFTFSNSEGEIITGYYGTMLKISKNSFEDENGNLITGEIDLELKEAFSPKDWVLGNLTTTYQNKPLESGGMIYVNASSEGKQVFLRSGKSIQVAIPVDSVYEDMSCFTGVKTKNGIEWENPIPIPPAPQDSLDKFMMSFEKITNIVYSVDGFASAYDAPADVTNEVSRIAWAGEGKKIKKDSVFEYNGFTIRFSPGQITTWSETFSMVDGVNTFVEDLQTSYIFSMKKLGWANIDRLINDPRTQEVEMIVEVPKSKEFKLVYVTLVTQNMYLPGYKMKNGSYSFAHNDEEVQQLPVGESATLIATAYIDKVPYFVMKKIVIEEKNKFELNLAKTTVKKMNAELEKNL